MTRSCRETMPLSIINGKRWIVVTICLLTDVSRYIIILPDRVIRILMNVTNNIINLILCTATPKSSLPSQTRQLCPVSRDTRNVCSRGIISVCFIGSTNVTYDIVSVIRIRGGIFTSDVISNFPKFVNCYCHFILLLLLQGVQWN